MLCKCYITIYNCAAFKTRWGKDRRFKFDFGFYLLYRDIKRNLFLDILDFYLYACKKFCNFWFFFQFQTTPVEVGTSTTHQKKPLKC